MGTGGPSMRLALALALLLVVPVRAAHAQDMAAALKSSTPAERAEIQTGLMKEKLALTAEQVPKIESINLGTAQAMEPIIKGSEGPLVKLRQAREIEQKKESQLQAVLTGDQYTKYLAMREEMKQKFEERLAQKAGGAK